MKYSGLYFISNPSTNIDASLSIVNTLIQSIESSFQSATRQAPWSLSYRAFRDTIPPGYQHPTGADGKPKPYAHSYQHLLHLSNLDSNRTYIYAQPATQPETVVSIPLRQQDAYGSVLKFQLSALWLSRHTFSVREGTTYSCGLCTIQIGELRATREGPQSASVLSPGIVVCITTTVGAEDTDDGPDSGHASVGNETTMQVDGDDDEIDFEYAQTVIREFWSKIKDGRDLGRSEVREVMMAPVAPRKKAQERDAAVHL
ncbi:mediator complex subunit med20 [Pyrenophora tritici-repentis]|uniref:Mediator of RNA polymerase II transcription subunit 20 n=1 Tax=Pyrenophora tritici-repentis TaxID=45151 RepID=A0A5M9L5D9_9PLEO|nr:mediator complex subunit med20 [Pyrenophora tritici-repentis]KAF7567997.1 putative mediator complex subunit med20 protein [Pyrenophora tritici-repentis]